MFVPSQFLSICSSQSTAVLQVFWVKVSSEQISVRDSDLESGRIKGTDGGKQGNQEEEEAGSHPEPKTWTHEEE